MKMGFDIGGEGGDTTILFSILEWDTWKEGLFAYFESDI